MKWMWLWVVFIVVLTIRLVFAFSTPFFTSDEAYLHYRIIESILQTGVPQWHDLLSWSGSTLSVSPLFDYVLAAFVSPIMFKIIPNIFASLLVFPVFLLARHFTGRYWISIASALIASFVPAFFAKTFNHISTAALAIPLFFFLLYCWLRVPEKKFVYLFIAGIILFALLQPSSLILILCLIIFTIISGIERLKITIADLELLLFSTGFVLWAQFILYKRAILAHGLNIIWLNIPSDLLAAFFSRLSLFDVLWHIGFFPLIVGAYVLYRTVAGEKSRTSNLFLASTIVILLLLWFRFVELYFGLMILGVLLVIFFAKGVAMFQDFIKNTKFAKLERLFIVLILLTAIFTSLIPSVFAARSELNDTISAEQVAALTFLRNNAEDDAVIITPVLMGHYVPVYAKRSNVIDSMFLLHDDAEERFNDIERIYSSVLETEVVSIFDKYYATHVFVPYGSQSLVFDQSDCFELIYDKHSRIYEKDPACHLRVVR